MGGECLETNSYLMVCPLLQLPWRNFKQFLNVKIIIRAIDHRTKQVFNTVEKVFKLLEYFLRGKSASEKSITSSIRSVLKYWTMWQYSSVNSGSNTSIDESFIDRKDQKSCSLLVLLSNKSYASERVLTVGTSSRIRRKTSPSRYSVAICMFSSGGLDLLRKLWIWYPRFLHWSIESETREGVLRCSSIPP